MYNAFFKRLIDFFVALCALICLSPFLMGISIWLYFANKKNGIFFRQERIGKDEKVFHILKFKSMTDETDAQGNLLPSKDRVTKAGRFIRSTSIDELPQLINVLKGEMSFIGPRPLFARYLPYYTERERLRHTVRPGITGLSQISGRNNLLLEQRLELDVQYVNRITFKEDMRILLRTFFKVLKREDVIYLPDPSKNIPLDVLRKKSNI